MHERATNPNPRTPPHPRTTKRRAREGQVLIVFALLVAGMLAMLGLALDGGRVYYARRAAQAAADAAAVAGAQELQRTNTSLVTAASRDDARLNGFDDAASDVTVAVSHPPGTGPRGGDSNYVEVVVSQTVPTTILNLVGATNTVVRARSVAGLEPDSGPPCVLALNPTASEALRANGSANLNAPDCRVMVNSNSTSAIRTTGGACITGLEIGFVQPGSYLGNGQACVSPQPQGRAIPAADPFASLVDPNPADYVERSNKRLKINNGNASSYSPLLPGYYKGGLQITGGTIVFEPGLYLIEGMKVSGNTTISGTGVTIFNNGAGLKGIDIAGTVSANLSAPLAGAWQNILFFNSRSVPKNNQTEVKITGNSSSIFEGVQYFPSVHVDYAGNSSAGPAWGMLIADTIRITGTPNLEISFDASSGRTPTTRRVTLVE